jgi:hypothetical protein
MTRRYFSTEIVSGGCKPTSASIARFERFSRRTGQIREGSIFKLRIRFPIRQAKEDVCLLNSCPYSASGQ